MRVVLVGYLMVVSFLGGMLNEKLLYGARRDAVLARYERALAEWKGIQMQIERETAGPAARRVHELATAQATGAAYRGDSIER